MGEEVLNNFKPRLFPIKNLNKGPTSEPTLELATEPTKHKKSKLKLQQELMNDKKYFGIILNIRICRF